MREHKGKEISGKESEKILVGGCRWWRRAGVQVASFPNGIDRRGRSSIRKHGAGDPLPPIFQTVRDFERRGPITLMIQMAGVLYASRQRNVVTEKKIRGVPC
jgi:hypothetical protein